MLARTYENNGDEREALASYIKTLYLYPNFLERKTVMDLAMNLIKNERTFRDRQEKLYRILETEPEAESIADRYWDYLSFLVQDDDDGLYSFVIDEARAFTGQHPEHSQVDTAMQWIGDLYLKKNDEREAMFSYLKLDFTHPGSPLLPYTQFQRGKLLYEEFNEPVKAAEILLGVATTYPESEYAGESLYLIGEIKEKKEKDFAGATASYRQLVDAYPNHKKSPDALMMIGEISAKRLNNFATAVAAYDEFIEKFSDNPKGVDALTEAAEIYEDDLESYEKAAEYYAKVAEVYPTYEKAPDLLIKAGELCEDKLGDYEKAIEYYQLVIDKFPESRRVGTAEKNIRKAKDKQL
jgi:TolA-binding protein